MFYIEDKVLEYPNKTIVSDLLTRKGPPNEESFTPYMGKRSMVEAQFKGKINNVNSLHLLVSTYEFKPSKARPIDKDSVDEYHKCADLNEPYYNHLEDIDEYFIDRYIKMELIGYKLNSKDSYRDMEMSQKTANAVLNSGDDGEEYMSLSELVEDSDAEDASKVAEAKLKIPYLLKIIHNDSVKFQSHLLSFLIASLKAYKYENATNAKSNALIRYGVYRMDADGRVTRKYDESDVTNSIYQTALKWLRGEGTFDKSPSYFATQELLSCCDKCDIDLSNENPLDYQEPYISNIVCSYIQTNEEYIDTYGMVDERVMKLLTPENLFKVNNFIKLDSDMETFTSYEVYQENIAVFIASLEHLEGWKPKPDLVNRFLRVLFKRMNQPPKTLLDYKIYHGVLKKKDDTFVTIDIKDSLSYFESRKFIPALLSISGKVVKVEADNSYLILADMEDMIDFYEGRTNSVLWKKISV